MSHEKPPEEEEEIARQAGDEVNFEKLFIPDKTHKNDSEEIKGNHIGNEMPEARMNE